MPLESFERLRSALDTFPTGLPKTEAGAEIEILKRLFSEQEAEIAGHLPVWMSDARAPNIKELAQKTGKTVDELKQPLEHMIKRGFIRFGGGESDGYWLVPFLPGIWEFAVDEFDRELVELFRQHLYGRIGVELEQKADIQPSRVVPMNVSVSSHQTVMPYQDVAKMLMDADSICVMKCSCRVEKKIAGEGEGCEKPLETCMFINDYAEHLNAVGKGRKVGTDEALDILKKAEAAGCIHVFSNAKTPHCVCNCCPCCCLILQGVTMAGVTGHISKSDYLLSIDEERCIGCEECLDRCVFKALRIENESVRVDVERCFGCGACVSACSQEALSLELKPRNENEDTPEDFVTYLNKAGWKDG